MNKGSQGLEHPEIMEFGDLGFPNHEIDILLHQKWWS